MQGNIPITVDIARQAIEENLMEYTFDLAWAADDAAHNDSMVRIQWAMPGCTSGMPRPPCAGR